MSKFPNTDCEKCCELRRALTLVRNINNTIHRLAFSGDTVDSIVGNDYFDNSPQEEIDPLENLRKYIDRLETAARPAHHPYNLINNTKTEDKESRE